MFGVKQIEAATVFGLSGKSIILGISPFLLNNITHSSKQQGQLSKCITALPQTFVLLGWNNR